MATDWPEAGRLPRDQLAPSSQAPLPGLIQLLTTCAWISAPGQAQMIRARSARRAKVTGRAKEVRDQGCKESVMSEDVAQKRRSCAVGDYPGGGEAKCRTQIRNKDRRSNTLTARVPSREAARVRQPRSFGKTESLTGSRIKQGVHPHPPQ